MRNIIFAEGEFYHIYNRGTDKRAIFSDPVDFARFLESMTLFNTEEPIGSIYEHSFQKPKLGSPASKSRLVNIVAYCLNQNHYHLILQPVVEKGIEKFMQRLGTGYTKYFNNRYNRNGVLFQGKFQAVHIVSNPQLLHVSAYVNLNYEIHRLGSRTSKSSWGEYINRKNEENELCKKDDILGQFRNIKEYRVFAENSVQATLARRGLLNDQLLME